MFGIDHYKYRPNMKLGEIASLYKYVVLDMDDLNETPLLEEFMRTHIRCVITSPFEWKQYWLERLYINCVQIVVEGGLSINQ